MGVGELVGGLRDRDDGYAYRCLKQLLAMSEESSAVYAFFDVFVQMLESSSSYIRTRGFLLICANARWDCDDKVDSIIGRLLPHIMDSRPIAARQCIKALPTLARHKPALRGQIHAALQGADPGIYADSMRSLVYKDIA